MRCICGNNRFYAHQLVRLDVVVDENCAFDSNLYDNAEAAIYDAEKPYGPFTCTVCNREYDEFHQD